MPVHRQQPVNWRKFSGCCLWTGIKTQGYIWRTDFLGTQWMTMRTILSTKVKAKWHCPSLVTSQNLKSRFDSRTNWTDFAWSKLSRCDFTNHISHFLPSVKPFIFGTNVNLEVRMNWLEFTSQRSGSLWPYNTSFWSCECNISETHCFFWWIWYKHSVQLKHYLIRIHMSKLRVTSN